MNKLALLPTVHRAWRGIRKQVDARALKRITHPANRIGLDPRLSGNVQAPLPARDRVAVEPRCARKVAP